MMNHNVIPENTSASIDEVIQAVIRDMDKRQKDEMNGLSTGFGFLDQMLDGLHKGNLIAVAGHPGVGATAFCLNIAEHISIETSTPILYLSMGLSKERLIERLLFGRSRIPLEKVQNGKLTREDLDTLGKTTAELSGKPLYIDDTPRLRASEIHERVQQYQKTKGVQCVIVDFLQAMRPSDAIDWTEEAFKEVARSLRLTALELNIPVLLLVELSFALTRMEDERTEPRMADLREAISIERYADVFMLINRHKYYGFCPPDSQTTEIMITRNRNGSTGFFSLIFQDEYARFKSLGPNARR